jgi:hypothetical protein
MNAQTQKKSSIFISKMILYQRIFLVSVMIFCQFFYYKCSNSINEPIQSIKQISKFKLDHIFDLANNRLQDDQLISGKKNTRIFKDK